MPKYLVSVRPQARDSLVSIFERIMIEYPSAAAKLLNEYQRSVESLSVLPERGLPIKTTRTNDTVYWLWMDRKRFHRIYYVIREVKVIVVDIRFMG